jgi:hypothetical protein
MSVLDIYRQVMLAGVIQPLQANLNFASGFSIVANPTLNSLDVSVTGGGGGISALTGDVTASGTGSVAATVARINGATVPAAGSLTTGNGLYVTGASALGYSALNLAGGAGYVTGALPAANQASQTMGGDISGTTASATVTQAQGGTIAFTGTTTPAITSGTSATQLTIGTNKAGSVLTLAADANIPAVTFSHPSNMMEANFFDQTGTSSGFTIQINNISNQVNLSCVPNYAFNLYCDGGASQITLFNNACEAGAASWWWAAGGGYFTFGGSAGTTATSPVSVLWNTATTPVIQSGNAATSLTVGTNKSSATLILQYGAATTAFTLGGNGFAPGVGTQACTAGGSITPTATVLANPYITLTGTLGSNTTIVLPNAVGMWWFDISGLTFGGDTLKFNSGTANTSTISSLVTTTEIVQVFCGGGNTISMNL